MEEALVFASIIVGVAVTDQIVSLHRLLRARARVRWDPLLLATALLVLLTLVQIWWSIAQPDPDARLTIGQFLPLLVQLILLVLLAAASLPDEIGPDRLDLRQYYAHERTYLWALYALNFAWSIAVRAAFGATGVASYLAHLAASWQEVAALAVMASLIVIGDRRWHAAIIALLYVAPLGWLSRSIG